jgi:hypothetical protein
MQALDLDSTVAGFYAGTNRLQSSAMRVEEWNDLFPCSPQEKDYYPQ